MSLKNKFLALSKSERFGMWFLLILLVTFLIISIFFNNRKPKNDTYDFSQFENEIDNWEKNLADNNESQRNYYLNLDNPSKSTTQSKLSPFDFDPNKLSQEEWKKMGLNNGQIKSILKFRTKGGVFKYKEDFGKMYVISKSEYEILEPHILLPNKTGKSTNNNSYTPVKAEKINIAIELNSADSTNLKKVKGIGSTFAKRIIRYRERLGGFVDINQLLEIKGIDSSNFPNLSSQLFVNPFSIRKIRINHASLEDLKKHPYISYNIALSLVNYRKQHGDFNEIADIKKSLLVTDEVYQKISPYISVK